MVNQTVPVIVRLTDRAASELAEIERESNTPPWSEKLFTDEFCQKHSLVYGARTEGKLVGFLVVHVTWDEAHIVNFGVRSEYRRRGIGRAMLDSVVDDLHNRGVRWSTLEVRRSNDPAKWLYGSFGFSEVGVRERYYSDNQEDAIVLSLNIRQYLDSRTTPPLPTAANG